MITVGSVAVDIVPSTERFATRLRSQIVPDADRIGKDIGRVISDEIASGIRKGIGEGFAGATQRARQQGSSSGGAFADAFRARVSAALRALPEPKIDADSSEADRKIAELRAKLETLRDAKIGVDIDAAEATAQITAIRTEIEALAARSPDVQVKVDAAKAAAELTAVHAMINRVDGDDVNVDVDVDTGAATAQLISLAGAAQVARVSITSIGVVAGATIATILIPALAATVAILEGVSQAAFGVGAALGVAFLALKPVFSAVQALSQADQSSATNAAAMAASQRSKANAIASAQAQIQSSEAALANTRASAASAAVNAAQRVSAAERAVGDARRQAASDVASALQGVQSAERNVASAQQSALAAQQALNDARKTAAQQLEDYKLQLADGALAQRGALLAIQRAKQQLDATNANPGATRLQREEAQLAYDQAVQRNTDLGVQQRRLRAEAAAADRAGVEGSQQVVRAKQQVTSATSRVSDAEAALARAQAAVSAARARGDQQVARAQEAVAAAQRAQTDQARQGAASIASAQRSVAAAQRSLANAYASTSTVGTSAAAKVSQAFAALTPAGASFARFIFSLRDSFKDLSFAAQNGFLPGFQDGIKMLLPYLPGLARFVGDIAKVMGDLTREASRALTGPFWRQFFDFVAKNAPRWLDLFSRSLGLFVVGVAGLFKGLAPIGDMMGDAFLGWMKSFADWASTLDKNKGFQDFLGYVKDNAPAIGQILLHLFEIIDGFVAALAPVGAAVAQFLAQLAPEKVALIFGIAGAAIASFGGPFIIVASFVAAALVGFISFIGTNEKAHKTVVAVWTAISTFIVRAWTDYIHPALLATERFIMTTLVPAILELWHNVIVPGFTAIARIVRTVWNEALYPVLSGLWNFLSTQVIPIVLQLWHDVFAPAFLAIGRFIVGMWHVAQPILAAMWWFIKTVLGPVIGWLAYNVVAPMLRSIGGAFTWVWQKIISPVLNALTDKMNSFPKVFGIVREGISRAWRGITDAIAGPINAVLKFVRDWFITPLNKMLSAVGLDRFLISFPGEAPPPSRQNSGSSAAADRGYAYGGTIGGYSPSDRADNIPIMATAGEYVLPVPATRRLRRLFGEGGLESLRRGLLPAFADGGIVERLGAFFSTAKNAVANTVTGAASFARDAAGFVTDPSAAIGRLVSNVMSSLGNSMWVQIMGRQLGRFGTGLADKVLGAIGFGSVGGAAPIPVQSGSVRLDTDTAARINRARIASGLGFNIIQGSWSNNPLSVGTHAGAGAFDLRTSDWGAAVSALRAQGLLAMFRNWPGNQHIHGLNPNVGGLSPQAMAQVRRAQANGGLFADGGPVKPLLFDAGGILPMGDSLVRNATGRPEPLARTDQLSLSDDDILRLASAIKSGAFAGTRAGIEQQAYELSIGGR